jgi:hypothetical protein
MEMPREIFSTTPVAYMGGRMRLHALANSHAGSEGESAGKNSFPSAGPVNNVTRVILQSYLFDEGGKGEAQGGCRTFVLVHPREPC